MAARQWFGDVALAVLVALPLAMLAYSQPMLREPSRPSLMAAPGQSPAGGRIGLLGR